MNDEMTCVAGTFVALAAATAGASLGGSLLSLESLLQIVLRATRIPVAK